MRDAVLLFPTDEEVDQVHIANSYTSAVDFILQKSRLLELQIEIYVLEPPLRDRPLPPAYDGPEPRRPRPLRPPGAHAQCARGRGGLRDYGTVDRNGQGGKEEERAQEGLKVFFRKKKRKRLFFILLQSVALFVHTLSCFPRNSKLPSKNKIQVDFRVARRGRKFRARRHSPVQLLGRGRRGRSGGGLNLAGDLLRDARKERF